MDDGDGDGTGATADPGDGFDGGDPTACPCEGAYDGGVPEQGDRARHYVWVAFLHEGNEDYRREEWLRDYYLLPTNWLTCRLSRSDIYHCQMFFWNQRQQSFVTFSVDAHQRHVHYSTRKQFGRGWTFVRLTVSRDQERTMYEWLARQALARAPFNQLGAMLLFLRPIDTGGHAWFCSQLVVVALQQAGFLLHVRPEAVHPAGLLDLLRHSGEFEWRESPHPVRTKHVWLRVAQDLDGTRPRAADGLIQF